MSDSPRKRHPETTPKHTKKAKTLPKKPKTRATRSTQNDEIPVAPRSGLGFCGAKLAGLDLEGLEKTVRNAGEVEHALYEETDEYRRALRSQLRKEDPSHKSDKLKTARAYLSDEESDNEMIGQGIPMETDDTTYTSHPLHESDDQETNMSDIASNISGQDPRLMTYDLSQSLRSGLKGKSLIDDILHLFEMEGLIESFTEVKGQYEIIKNFGNYTKVKVDTYPGDDPLGDIPIPNSLESGAKGSSRHSEVPNLQTTKDSKPITTKILPDVLTVKIVPGLDQIPSTSKPKSQPKKLAEQAHANPQHLSSRHKKFRVVTVFDSVIDILTIQHCKDCCPTTRSDVNVWIKHMKSEHPGLAARGIKRAAKNQPL